MKYSRNGAHLECKYSPDQARDESGRFGSGGAGRSSGEGAVNTNKANAATAKVNAIANRGRSSRDGVRALAHAHNAAGDAHAIAGFTAVSKATAESHRQSADYHRDEAIRLFSYINPRTPQSL